MSSTNTHIHPNISQTEPNTELAWAAFARRDAAALTETVTLRDGTKARFRALRPDDVARLQAFHLRLSVETIVMRYFRVAPTLYARDARRLTHMDYDRRMALVATMGDGQEERIIGVVRYEPISTDEGELAFVVEDQWQGHGVSTRLLAILLAYGRARGYRRMTAVTMVSNARMRAVLEHAGYPCFSQYTDGALHITLDITALPARS